MVVLLSRTTVVLLLKGYHFKLSNFKNFQISKFQKLKPFKRVASFHNLIKPYSNLFS